MSLMPEFRCGDCGTYHEPPKCGHRYDRECLQCRRPIGFLGYGQPRDGVCSRCWLATPGIAIPDSVPAVRPADWLEDVA